MPLNMNTGRGSRATGKGKGKGKGKTRGGSRGKGAGRGAAMPSQPITHTPGLAPLNPAQQAQLARLSAMPPQQVNENITKDAEVWKAKYERGEVSKEDYTKRMELLRTYYAHYKAQLQRKQQQQQAAAAAAAGRGNATRLQQLQLQQLQKQQQHQQQLRQQQQQQQQHQKALLAQQQARQRQQQQQAGKASQVRANPHAGAAGQGAAANGGVPQQPPMVVKNSPHAAYREKLTESLLSVCMIFSKVVEANSGQVTPQLTQQLNTNEEQLRSHLATFDTLCDTPYHNLRLARDDTTRRQSCRTLLEGVRAPPGSDMGTVYRDAFTAQTSQAEALRKELALFDEIESVGANSMDIS